MTLNRETDDWLLQLLRCPNCGGGLRRDAGVLACASRHEYPVLGNIPRFTPPSSYADSFGFEWTRFPRLQLDSTNRTESEEAFAEKTGLRPEDVEGRSVLDAGCGMGRFSDVVARWGAGRVLSVDLSRAVEAAADNLRQFESVRVVQADLRSLPLVEGSFDVVFSIGVLHHTPNTRRAFERLARFVKPGGLFHVWVYSRRLQVGLAGSEVLRLVTRRMEPLTLLRTVERVEPRVTAMKRRLPAASRIINAVVPVSSHHDAKWRILDTFDWYSPRYQWKHTYREVEGWFRELGFEAVRRLPFPVSVRGRRPETTHRPLPGAPHLADRQA